MKTRTLLARSTSAFRKALSLVRTRSARPRILTPFIDDITEAVKVTRTSVASSQSFWRSIYGAEPSPERYDKAAENTKVAMNLFMLDNSLVRY